MRVGNRTQAASHRAMFRPESSPLASPGHGPIESGAGARTATADRGALRAAHWPRLCHDLRTPLNAILGNAELLLDGSVGPLSREARACVGDVQAAGEGILRQVQALLDL
jgi:signal transduction histidine kinase